LFELDPESQVELDALLEAKADNAEALAEIVKRVCADPSGKREPKHRYTRPFPNAKKHVAVPPGAKAWELVANHWRALFMTVEEVEGEVTYRLIVFLPKKGVRFWPIADAPWHKGK